MSTLSKIEYAGRVFYYDPRGHTHVTTGNIERGDLLFLDAGETLRCYPAFWDDIGRPMSEFPLGALRPVKNPNVETDTRTWSEQFVDMIDCLYPKNSPLIGTLATVGFIILLAAVGLMLLFL